MKRMILVAMWVAGAVFPSRVDAQVDPWGPYAQVAGRSGISDSGRTKVRWYWIEPGRSLMQEYRRTKDDLVFRETLITLGSAPGTLLVAGRPVGLPPEPVRVASIQQDGRLFVQTGDPTPDAGYIVAMAGGNVLAHSAARLSGGRVVPNEEDDRAYTRFALEPGAADAVASADVVPSGNVPVAAGVPGLGIGEEVAGDLSTGIRGKYGPGIPIGAYRFVGQQGQRVCARVGSTDTYVHVYLADSLDPGVPPLFSSWLPNYDDFAAPTYTAGQRYQGTSLMATLPRSGEYFVYVVAHGQGPVAGVTGRQFQRYKHDLFSDQGGTYALKLWDADVPEPPSRDPELARTQHPDSGDATWLGNLAQLLEGQFVGQETAVALQFRMQGANLVQQSAALETGAPLPDWVYVPTGRRGEYRLARDGRILQVQCDGNWTLTGDKAETLHFSLYGGGGVERNVQMSRLDFKPLYRYPSGRLGTTTYGDGWMEFNDKNVAQVLQYLDDGRAIARENAENRARSAAEDAANRQAMMAGILGGFASGLAEEAGDQQYAQDQFEDAVRRGQRQGLSIRRAQEASDALARMEPAGPLQGPVATSDGEGSDAAGALILETPDTHTPAAVEEPRSNTRERYIVCEVVHNGNFDGNHGVLFQSSVGTVTLVDNRQQGDPPGTFLGKVQARYGVGGSPVCQTGASPGELEARLLEWQEAYPGYKAIPTSMTPL